MYSEDLDCWIEKGTRSDRTPVALLLLLLFELYCFISRIMTCDVDQNGVYIS